MESKPGALATVTDSATGIKTTYYYDFTDRLMKYTETASSFSHTVGYTFDQLNNLTKLVETINGVTRTLQYTYDDDNRVAMVQDGATRKFYTYDEWGRLTTRRTNYDWNIDLTQTFGYNANSAQVNSLTTTAPGYSQTLRYTYDDNGNILSVYDGTYTTSYVYDSANQLIRENNQAGGFTYTWTYDNGGNITCRTEYAYTTGTLGTPTDTVTYGYYTGTWRDLIEYYDGEYITTDTLGNTIKDEKDWIYTWEHGRELLGIVTDDCTWTFTYDANGLRTHRTNGITTYDYIYNGGSLIQMTVTDELDGSKSVVTFAYDAAGKPMSLDHNGTRYIYVTNIQGDVIALSDTSGNKVVEYTYDAWGNILSITGSMAATLGQLNPLRYRGYVYDQETGLYYLQSRYYNPGWGRFINADTLVSTGQGILGNNMFAYCNNNPVMYTDPSGEFLLEVLATITIAEAGKAFLVTVTIFGIVVFSEFLYDALETIVNWLSNQWSYSNIEFIPAQQELEQAQIEAVAPHTKNKSERTRNKHEYGDSRRQRDQGGEKKKTKKGWTPNPNKRKENKFVETCFISD